MGGTTPETFRALEEIHRALELAPNDPVVREIAENLVYMIEGGMTQNGERFDFPWLTQTPTALPPTPTLVPVEESTVTALPIATNTPLPKPTQPDPTYASPTAVPQNSSPICGSAVFLPLMAVVWIYQKSKSRTTR